MKRKLYFILIVAIALSELWIAPSYALNPVHLANAAQTLPPQVSQRIKQKVAELTKVNVDQVEILIVEPRTWPDGCLGIQSPDSMCTQALVPGWLITVKSGKERLNYRTDKRGNLVYLDPSSSP